MTAIIVHLPLTTLIVTPLSFIPITCPKLENSIPQYCIFGNIVRTNRHDRGALCSSAWSNLRGRQFNTVCSLQDTARCNWVSAASCVSLRFQLVCGLNKLTRVWSRIRLSRFPREPDPFPDRINTAIRKSMQITKRCLFQQFLSKTNIHMAGWQLSFLLSPSRTVSYFD